MVVALALGLVTLSMSAAVAASRSEAAGPLVREWSRWVTPGNDATVRLAGVPSRARTATFAVTVSGATSPTKIVVCGEAKVTAGCQKAASAPMQRGALVRTVALTKGSQISVRSTASKVRVTLRLVRYEMGASVDPSSAQPAPTATLTTTPSTAPSISETPATAAPDPTPEAVPPSTQPQPSGDWPGPGNTGVPAGTKLQVLEPTSKAPAGTAWSGNVLKVTTNGTVLDSLEIRALVRVEAKDVVIKNCLITGQYLSSSFSLLYISGPGYSVTVRDSEMYAKYPSPYVRAVIGYNFTLERVNLHHTADNIAITGDNVVVKDSWLHDPLYYLEDPVFNGTPTHDDNAQIQQGRHLTFIHNTMSGTHNAAIQVTQDAGVVGDLLLENNLISNGGCSINLAQKERGPIQGVTLRGNRFTHTSTYNCAVIISPGSRSNLTMTDNRWVTWNGSTWVADQSGTVPVLAHSS